MPACLTSYFCSDYPHLFGLDPVTAAVWLVFFDLIVSNMLCEIMGYASKSKVKLSL
jgi:hypothetical protein